MKHIGSKNKPKYIKVKIEDLNKIFQSGAEIEISAAYSILFPNAVVPIKESDEEASAAPDKLIEFTVT